MYSILIVMTAILYLAASKVLDDTAKSLLNLIVLPVVAGCFVYGMAKTYPNRRDRRLRRVLVGGLWVVVTSIAVFRLVETFGMPPTPQRSAIMNTLAVYLFMTIILLGIGKK